MSAGGPQGRLRLFLDANVLVSGLLFRGPERELLLAATRGACEAVTSEYVLAQVRRVLVRKFGLPGEEVEQVLGAVGMSVCREPSLARLRRAEALLRDPEDAPVLAATWAAKADGLVTGDRDFWAAAPTLEVRLLKTREALALLTEQ